MANCGPNDTPLEGTWAGLQLEVASWRVWCWVQGAGASWLACYSSEAYEWRDVPDSVLAVVVYHDGDRKTFMWFVDVYPPPPGTRGEVKQGVQIGEVHGPEWAAIKARIKAEA